MSRTGLSIVPKNLPKLTDKQEDDAIEHNQNEGKIAVWSILELSNSLDDVAYKGKINLIYRKEDYWSVNEKTKKIEDGKKDLIFALPNNPTWRDIWKAADKAIFTSSDHHHVFIEDIALITHKGKKYLTMSLGS